MTRGLVSGAIALFLVSFIALPGYTQQQGAQLTFTEPVYDFGTVYTDSLPDTRVVIEFTNTGNEPLLISGVRACCGTRVEEWPREPILPGGDGKVIVNFRMAAAPQNISRTVTITYNNTERPSSVYRIVGRVVSR